MKKFFSKSVWGYNFLDLILVLVGLISVITTSIIFGSSWLIIVNSVLGILTVFTQAKGKVITQFIGIAWFVFYIVMAVQQSYYGEAILYGTIMIPMYIYGVIHWLSHRDKKGNFVIVRKNLPAKEWLFMFLGLSILSVGIYFLLSSLNTAQLWLSTIAFCTMLPCVYLLIRRCKWNQLFFLINDIVLFFLWQILVLKGNLTFLPIMCYQVCQIIYDAYGFIEWIKLEKKQKAKGIQENQTVQISKD